MEVFYSSPTRYLDAVTSNTSVKWNVKTDDFFPYADNNISYWTGKFRQQKKLQEFGVAFYPCMYLILYF